MSGSGTPDSPVDLQTGFSIATVRLHLLDGIYTVSSQIIIPGIEVIGHGLAIVTNADGYPPALYVATGGKLNNIWLGGTKFANENGRVITLGHNVTIQNCTFWGYSQCLTPGTSGYQNNYLNNRFVNCGFGSLYHDIYISNGIATYDNISENIHVGGAGFKIHLYHNPEYVTIHANFMQSGHSDLAVQQANHIVTNNILWNIDPGNTYWNANTCTFNKNIIGPDRDAFTDLTANNTADGNVFCNGQSAFGTNPQAWDAAAITANLGHSKAEIDTAISNLITKFGQTTAEIAADATIETDFAVLRAVIDAWKDQ